MDFVSGKNKIWFFQLERTKSRYHLGCVRDLVSENRDKMTEILKVYSLMKNVMFD